MGTNSKEVYAVANIIIKTIDKILPLDIQDKRHALCKPNASKKGVVLNNFHFKCIFVKYSFILLIMRKVFNTKKPPGIFLESHFVAYLLLAIMVAGAMNL